MGDTYRDKANRGGRHTGSRDRDRGSFRGATHHDTNGSGYERVSRNPGAGRGDRGDRPAPAPPLHTEKVEGAKRKFFLDVRRNERGGFLQICEVSGNGDRHRILIDSDDVPGFYDAVCGVVAFMEENSLIKRIPDGAVPA